MICRLERTLGTTVLGATLICLMSGRAGAQEFGLDSGSTTGNSFPSDSGFPESGDMPEFNFDDGSGNWQPGPGGGRQVRPGPPPDEALMVLLAVYGVMFAVIATVYLTIRAVACWLISAPLAALPEHCREMAPWQVWLLMIPCFDMVWTFFVSQRVSRSFQNYFVETGRTEFGDCGAQIGLWWSICVVCSFVPCVNYAAGPAQLVLLIIFLVKLWGLKAEVGPATSLGTA